MAEPFNPDEPCVVGVQWFPPFESGPKLDGPRNGQVAIMEATDTDADPELWVNFPAVSRTGEPVVAVDIYEYGTYDVADTTTGVHRPTSDVRNIDGYAWGSFAPAGTQTNIYRGIDSATLTQGTWPNTGAPVTNDEFIYSIFGAGYEVTFRFGGIVGSYTGRIVTVDLKARVNLFVDIELIKGMRVTPYVNVNGQRYFGPSQAFSDTAKAGHLLTASWAYNPATGGPWTIADVEEFDSVGGTDSAGWIVDATGSSNNLATIMQGWLEVTESTPDNRVGAGVFQDVGGSPAEPVHGWNKAYMTIPWNKQAGTTYVLHFYRSSGRGSVGLRRVIARDDEAGDHNGHEVAEPVYFTRNDRLASITEDVQPGAAIAMVVTDTGGTPQTDSQPYVSVGGDVNLDCGVNELWPTYLADFKQLMTPSAGGDYGFLRALIRTTNGAPTGALTVGVYRESDDTLMSSLESIALADLSEPTFGAQGWQVIEVEFATPATLVGGTQYYVSFVDVESGQWEVQVLSCGLITKPPPCGPTTGAEDTKWGGTTDPLRIDGTDQDGLTAAVTIHVNGPALAAFAVAAESDAWVDDCLSHAHITWELPAPSACDAESVEVQRSDDGGTTWHVVAREYSGTIFEFDDYECKRNVPVKYRARLRMVGGGVGEMSAEETVTVPTCCGITLASNLLPSLAAFYVDVGDRSYTFQENVERFEFENRDYSLLVHELAYRGDTFELTLLLGGTDATLGTGVNVLSTLGRSVFTALLEAVRPNLGATVPYIAVMNENGDRWFASLEVPTGDVLLARLYEARVVVVEVTDTPYPVSILGGS